MSDLKGMDIEMADKETALYGKFASMDKDKSPDECTLVFGLASSKALDCGFIS